MKKVKCSFKKVGAEDIAAFSTAGCLLRISVGQKSHEDLRFEAAVKLVESSFNHCTVALHDTLQRHTMAISEPGMVAEDYREDALSLGEHWLARNKPYYEGAGIEFTVIRWDDWLNKPEYNDWKAVILAELKSNDQYRDSFDHSVKEYLDRYGRRLENADTFDWKRAEKLCLDYLVEECAAMCMWPQTGCQYEVYAGTDNQAMNATRELFIHSKYPELLHSISIGFNRRPDMSPQVLDLVSEGVVK
jgi:hypothetical protein